MHQVLGSNLGPETGYPYRGFSWFFAVSPGECQDSTLKFGYDSSLPDPLQFIVIHFSLSSVSEMEI
jgi:hypothetical protein